MTNIQPRNSCDLESGTTQPTNNITSRIARHLNQTIPTDTHILEAELLILTLATGIQDAVAYPDFQCFASNQTGNTVILSIGLLGLAVPGTSPYTDVTHASISLSLFATAVFVQGQLASFGRLSRKRWWLLCSSVLQVLFVVCAAVIQGLHDGSSKAHVRAALGLLAAASGLQIGMVRALGVVDLNTALATTAYVDVLSDAGLWKRLAANRLRNRRVGLLVALALGCMLGALVYKEMGGAGALAFVASVKVVVVVLMMFNRGEGEQKQEMEDARTFGGRAF